MSNPRAYLLLVIGLAAGCAVLFAQDAPPRGRGQRPSAEPNSRETKTQKEPTEC